ncbi:glycosyltransferase [Edwardsiella tarda]|uniref:glycosyltransferase n=1 Tax=Edwardsiella tarda TaxID=636 RepID=UPI00351C5BCE
MNICFVITGLGMGGAERQVVNLADEMCKMGHNILILVLNKNIIVKPKEGEVKIEEVNLSKNPFVFVYKLLKTKKIVEQFNPDVVHSHMIHANIFARLLRIIANIPFLICSAHNTNEGGLVRQYSYRLTNFLSDLNTNVSGEAVYAFEQKKIVKKGTMLAIPNGIDTSVFKFSACSRDKIRKYLNICEDTVLFLAVGRLEEQKDYPLMIKSFSKVVKHSILENKKALLCIIGTGYLRDSLDNLINSLNLNENVILLGLQRNVEEWMSAADYYLMSSKWEGLPLVIAEAMASKCYVISTDCGGVREMISNNNQLVPVSDEALFAEKIISSLELSSMEKERIVYNEREIVINNYSIKKAVDLWMNIYNKGCHE